MNVDFNDPKTLYAYLNQNCGTISPLKNIYTTISWHIQIFKI